MIVRLEQPSPMIIFEFNESHGWLLVNLPDRENVFEETENRSLHFFPRCKNYGKSTSSNRVIDKWEGSSQTEVHQWGEGLTIRENGFRRKTHNLTGEESIKVNGCKRIKILTSCADCIWKRRARQQIEMNVIVHSHPVQIAHGTASSSENRNEFHRVNWHSQAMQIAHRLSRGRSWTLRTRVQVQKQRTRT